MFGQFRMSCQFGQVRQIPSHDSVIGQALARKLLRVRHASETAGYCSTLLTVPGEMQVSIREIAPSDYQFGESYVLVLCGGGEVNLERVMRCSWIVDHSCKRKPREGRGNA